MDTRIERVILEGDVWDMRYAELHCKSNFTFLEGASHPDELVERAAELGYAGLAITDRASVAGVVRGFGAAKGRGESGESSRTQGSPDGGFRFLVGSELELEEGPSLVVWPSDRAAYGRMCRLISRGRMRGEKGTCRLAWDDVDELADGLLVGVSGVSSEVASDSLSTSDSGSDSSSGSGTRFPLGRLADRFGDRAYLLCELHRGVDDGERLRRLRRLSRQSGLPLLAAGDVHYHVPERMRMHDCVTAIRHRTTIERIVSRRFANAERHLRPLAEIATIYRDVPDAVERTVEVAERCRFRLDELRYEYPEELAPAGVTPIEHLKRLTWAGAKRRWPDGVPDTVIETLRREVGLIEELRYEAYFLTVWDMVRFAREEGILCQGRGSAANSAVCYCLGITNVDPTETDLLFERFVSRERDEAPDIDVDFEHQRREEVLQYVYRKYGRDRAGMTAAVTSYRTRSAIREVGKALGISADTIDSAAKLVGHSRMSGRSGLSGHSGLAGHSGATGNPEATGNSDPTRNETATPNEVTAQDETAESEKEAKPDEAAERFSDRLRQAGLDPGSEVGGRFVDLVSTLQGFPRHLSQHVGGMVITAGRLSEICPIENAAMDGRTVIQWDKDDLDELGILKVDVLALGMLSALHRCFDLVATHHAATFTLATIPANDEATYDMICKADTLGVFQIESRAQMSMLPRLRPRCFYDLVVEVAIVRPGPIQGNMVHPYLKARRNPGSVVYPNEAIRGVLEKTLGVPIFQEQAMKLAVVAAGFTPGEADQLRRAMAAWRRPGVIDRFRVKLLEGMRAKGLSDEFAEHVFHQIRGFGEYGFPESHAASFALLVYASCYLKCHYPAAFCAAMLNSQPLGFYAPAQLVADARDHGVTVRAADVNHSDRDSTLEPVAADTGRPAIRLGLRTIRGLSSEVAERVTARRHTGGPFADVGDLTRRCELSRWELATLADADALASLAGDRRAAVWESLGQDRVPGNTPLLAGIDDTEELPETLSPMSPMEEVHADYRMTGLSLKAHPISFVRHELRMKRCVTAAELAGLRDGRHVRVGGLVLLRQRPGTAKGITFVTLEDETGPVNLVLFPAVWDAFFRVARASNAWLVDGKLENREGVIHVIVGRLTDLTEETQGLSIRSRDFH